MIIRSILTGLLCIISLGTQAAEQIVTLELPTMNCAMCPITVKKSLEKVEGVYEVEVLYSTKEARVRYDDNKATASALAEATTNAGYPSSVKGGVNNDN